MRSSQPDLSHVHLADCALRRSAQRADTADVLLPLLAAQSSAQSGGVAVDMRVALADEAGELLQKSVAAAR